MTAKKQPGAGRATPKGTKNPGKKGKAKRSDLPVRTSASRTELPGKKGKQSQWAPRPVSHNRGNR